MRKFITILVVAIAALSASAQKGMMGVGVLGGGSLGVGGDVKSAGEVGVIFQYNCLEMLRIQPYVNVDFADDFGYGVGLNFNLFFSKSNNVRPFLYVGGGFVSRCCIYDYEYETTNGGGVNAGIGLDYRISHSVTLMAQFGPQVMFLDGETAIALDPKVGICYNF